MPAAILALGILLLAGCAPTPGEAGPLPPGAKAEAVDGPSPLLSISCDDLIDAEAVQRALGSVEPGDDPIRIPGGSWPLGHVGLAQQGALDCYWGDDAAPQEEYSRYLSVTVLPEAAEGWARQQSALSSWSTPLADHGDAAFRHCAGSGSYLYCKYDVLVGAAWLHAEVANVDSHDDAAPIIRLLTDAVADADPGAPSWSPAETIPASCSEWITAAEISAAVGMEGIAEREFPLMMPIILGEGLSAGLACSWSNAYSSEQAMPVQVAAVPDAEWAWESAWAKSRPERSPAEPLDGVGDRAFAGCATDQNVCFVDVLAGGTWITVDGNKEAGIEGLKQVAATAVARVSS